MNKARHVLLTILAYIVATFGVQGVSHFLVNAGHYASLHIMRSEPVFFLGFASMLIQGLVFAGLFPIFHRSGSPMSSALRFSWAMGAVLGSYIALAEAGKYAVTDVGSWFVVEAGAAAIQFTIFGLFLGLIHRKASVAVDVPST